MNPHLEKLKRIVASCKIIEQAEVALNLIVLSYDSPLFTWEEKFDIITSLHWDLNELLYGERRPSTFPDITHSFPNGLEQKRK